MIRFIYRRLLVGLIASTLLLVFGSVRPATAREPQDLTVGVSVCPDGYDGSDFAADCSRYIAHAFDVSVNDADCFEVVAGDVPPDDDGRARIDLTGWTPSTLRVTVSNEYGMGTRDVWCSVGGEALDVELPSTRAGIPIFVIAADAGADVDCTVYVFWDPRDGNLLGVTEVAPTADESNDRELDERSDVTALPATGSGSHQREVGVGLPLAVFALVAGSWLRRRTGVAWGWPVKRVSHIEIR